MKRRLIAMAAIALLGLFGAGCDDTLEGAEQDIEEGADAVEEEVDDGDDG